MRDVTRAEILDLGAYEAIRLRFRDRIIAMKRHRRVAVGDHMTFIFENRDTVLFQIQEMLRTERITTESAIEHELRTYNDLVPGDGELSATLMIEYDDDHKAERAEVLSKLADLEGKVMLRAGGETSRAILTRLPGEEPDRLPAVNYLRSPVSEALARHIEDASAEVLLQVEHPAYPFEALLTAATRRELSADLRER